MLKKTFNDIIMLFRLSFYKNIFSRFETDETTLTAVETFCVEVISALNRPTINEFAKFVNISQANATYKIQSLIRKGYVIKERSNKDKREYFLTVTNLFDEYSKVSSMYFNTVMDLLKDRFTKEELEAFEKVLLVMRDEIIPSLEPAQSR